MLFGMTASELATLMGAIAAPMGLVGAGLKALIKRADGRAKAREDEFEGRLKEMDATIKRMARRDDVLLRRVYHLEAIMEAKGIDLPETPGWPLEVDV